MKKYGISILFKLLFIISFFYSQSVFAAGYLLEGESTSALGEAFSGGAAIIEDASANYFNPAGLVLFKHPQFVGSGEMFFLRNQFTGNTQASYTLFGSSQNLTGTTHTSIKAPVPAFYFVTPFIQDWVWLGFGVTAPCALSINYPNDSILRFAITNEKLQTVNFNLNIGFKIFRQFFIGGGIDVLRADSLAKSSILSPFDPSPDAEWNFDFDSNALAYGANIGFLYQPCESMRFGLSYRSEMNITTNGNANVYTRGTLTPSQQAPLSTKNFHLVFQVPPITYLSAFFKINPCWDVMGTVEMEQWSIFQRIQALNVPIPTTRPMDIYIPENFHDTFTFAAGTRYQWNKQWRFKTGVVFVPSSVSSNNRDILVPATNSVILAFGAHYQPTRCLGFEVAYSHPFFGAAPLSHSRTITPVGTFFPISYTTSEIGTTRLSGNIVGAQVSYDFL